MIKLSLFIVALMLMSFSISTENALKDYGFEKQINSSVVIQSDGILSLPLQQISDFEYRIEEMPNFGVATIEKNSDVIQLKYVALNKKQQIDYVKVGLYRSEIHVKSKIVEIKISG